MEQLAFDFRLTVQQQALINLLSRGRERAVAVKWLEKMTGINERRVRQLVRHLIDHHGYAIGSSTVSPTGYYLINDPEELEQFRKAMRRRGISILVRVAHVTGNSLIEVFNQGILELTEEEAHAR